MKKLFIFLVTGLLLASVNMAIAQSAGSGSFDAEKLQKIQVGTSETVVKDLLGEPTKSIPETKFWGGGQPTISTVLYYGQNNEYYVKIQDGKVTEKSQ